eukprot:12314930-Alexandrium_andersonii.AAC.1
MLDYHAWVLGKLTESKPRASLAAVIDADFRMRTAWMLMYTQGEAANLTEAVKNHRGRCATAPSTTRAATAR